MESTRELLVPMATATRFLLTSNKPEKGSECQGIETLPNGFTELIETEKFSSVKEVSANKYICSGKMHKYLVDLITI